MRDSVVVGVWWHIYIIRLDNRGFKARGLNFTKCFYTGITCRDIGMRFGDYIFCRGKGYVNDRWRNARKVPVYVEYFYGNEFEALKRERKIKNLCASEKDLLIVSDKNMLKRYIPLKAIILRKNNSLDESLAIRIR